VRRRRLHRTLSFEADEVDHGVGIGGQNGLTERSVGFRGLPIDMNGFDGVPGGTVLIRVALTAADGDDVMAGPD